MSKPNLPDLPEPTIEGSVVHPTYKIAYFAPVHFTADQMRAYAEEAVRPYIEALERIADEEFISLGEGNVDVRPALSDREACSLARAALMGMASPGHKPAPVDTSSGHSAPETRDG